MGPKQRRSELLTKETPYKPYAGKPHVRICAGGARQLASLPLKRREFIAGLGGAAAWSLFASAQQSGIPVIGFLSSRSPNEAAGFLAAFQHGLAEVGFNEGQNSCVRSAWSSNGGRSSLSSSFGTRWFEQGKRRPRDALKHVTLRLIACQHTNAYPDSEQQARHFCRVNIERNHLVGLSPLYAFFEECFDVGELSGDEGSTLSVVWRDLKCRVHQKASLSIAIASECSMISLKNLCSASLGVKAFSRRSRVVCSR